MPAAPVSAVQPGHPGDTAELDSLLGQCSGFVGRRFAVDRVAFRLAVMNAARLLGENGGPT